MFWWYEKLQFPQRFSRCHSSNSIRFLFYHTRIIIDFFGFILMSYMISLVSYKDHIWFLWSHIRISHFFKRVFFVLWMVHLRFLGFHAGIIYEKLDFKQGSYMISLVSYKDHIWFLWSHTRISHFFKRVFFVWWMVHLRFLGFHAGIIYENLDFIQGSYMISLVSYKDHIWFLWSHKRISHFFKRVFFRFMNGPSTISWSSFWDLIWKLGFRTRIIYDFFDFKQGSYMISLVSYKDHIWFLWSHTRISHFFKRVFFVWWMVHLRFLGFHAGIIYENLDFIQGSYMISLVSYKDHIWFLWSHIRISHFFKRVFFVLWMVHLRFLGFHAGITYEKLDFKQGSYMISLVSYKDHIWFLWSHTRISHFFKRVFFVWWMVHLRFLGFHAGILYENLNFIQGSYMISLVSYKDHIWFLWSHKRISHFFKRVFFSFHERSIYDFLEFILGSYMKTWISYKDHIWFLWFQTRIIYDFFGFIQGSYMISLISYKDLTLLQACFFSFDEWSIYDFLDFMLGSYMKTWISYKDHIWFLWFHTRIIYDFFDLIKESHTFSSVFFFSFHERSIYDFLEFILGSYMKTWISYKDHIWFLWFHTRIVLRNRVWTVWNHIWSLYEIKETSTRVVFRAIEFRARFLSLNFILVVWSPTKKKLFPSQVKI